MITRMELITKNRVFKGLKEVLDLLVVSQEYKVEDKLYLTAKFQNQEETEAMEFLLYLNMEQEVD